MAAIDNHRIRFMSNNLISLTVPSFTYSSEKTGFEANNALNNFRSEIWKPTGHFEITSSNNKIYINDGGAVTITLTAASYTTPDLLATHIQTQLNASSSNWTVSYSATTYKFTISNTGSVTLVLTSTTNAAWDTIGFTGASDLVGTSFTATEQRNHTEEFLKFDLGYQAEIDFLGVIGSISSVFSLSSSATVTLEGNNIDDFSSPPFSETVSVTEKGIFNFFDNSSDNRYRFWRLKIEDKFNFGGPEGIEIGNVYMGSYETFTARNVGKSFQIQEFDPSSISESQSGVIFFDKRTKYRVMNSLPFFALDQTSRETLQDVFEDVGKTTPFYVSIDPQLRISTDIEDLTMFGVFTDSPTFSHIVNGLFSTTLKIRELV